MTTTLSFTYSEKGTIVIDVSHGGIEQGSQFEKFNEKDIVLNIANKIKELNENSDIEIILTRDSGKFVSLEDRTEFINSLKPEFVISIHVNSSKDTSKFGTEIFVSEINKQNEKSNKLAEKIKIAFQSRKTQIKTANFYLLKNVNFPIAFIEIGYLSNENDRALLTNEEGQSNIAKMILNVIK